VIELSRYAFESLRTDQEFILYRARRSSFAKATEDKSSGGREGVGSSSEASAKEEPPSILVLAPVFEQPELGTLQRLEHECSLRDELDLEWAVRPIELSYHWDRLVLILEDPGGVPLNDLLGEHSAARQEPRPTDPGGAPLYSFEGQPMELGRFLRIAVNLAAGLRKLHRSGLVHKDIKPAHILVDPVTDEVWFTGFGISSGLIRERQAAELPEMIAGTLAYMAPEQTGRMNRSIDSRSDLYSLGVTFYQILTGCLPFTASDPMEWVHCHIAKQPANPSRRRPEVPEPISALVLKLLSKTAEERYQTAAGLEFDLRKCLLEWERGSGGASPHHIEEFPLGEHDVADRLLIPEKLYGRTLERQKLLDAFQRVASTGKPELVLVSGYSGIGKSSVVHELHKVVLPNGFFVSGKFDENKRDIPYVTLAQAFQTLIRQILSKSQEELNYWHDAILEALGSNAQLMVDLIVELELVIGKQPPVPELLPLEAQNRFEAVLRQFLGVFAQKAHPLVLFLDDLQWLDPATLRLIEQFITYADIGHLLLIGAYRDNEVTAGHPLMLTLKAIRETGVTVHEIVLKPLSLEDVNQLVADSLHSQPAHTRQLAALVHKKTGGNPFFTLQFLSTLADEQLLAYEPQESAWRWNVKRIRALGFTDNVADLVIAKLRRLPAATQEALKQFACLGHGADAATLSIVRGGSEESVQQELWEAVRAGLIQRSGASYKFLHDRIREAAYLLIPEQLRARFHLNLGRLLVSRMTAEQTAEQIFDIANQLNFGLALISDHLEREQVAELNLIAGKKAKASAAYASACVYLSAGMELIGSNAWERRYQLAFGLWLERAECEYLNGNFEAADGLIADLLDRAESKTDKAATYRLKILLDVMRAQYRRAVDNGLECLRLFGIDIPTHPSGEEVKVDYEKIWQNLGDRSIESLIELPLMSDPEKQAAMQVLAELSTPAWYTDRNLFCLHVCHMTNMTLKYGITGVCPHGFAELASILGPVFHRFPDGYRFGKLACSLVDKYGLAGSKMRTYLGMARVAPWTRPMATAVDFVRRAFRAGIDTHERSYACFTWIDLVTDLLLQGVHLDQVLSESEKGLHFARKAKFRDAVDFLTSQQQFIQSMRGQTVSFASLSDDRFDEGAFEAQLTEDRMSTMVCYYWIFKLQARFISGDYDAAMAAAQKAKALLWSAETNIQSLNYCYYSALTLAAIHDMAGPQRQAEALEELKRSLEQLREWSDNCPETFVDKYKLVSGELARIQGRELDAMRLYEDAIQAARQHGFIQNEGIGNELAAHFYLKRGYRTVALTYLCEARHCFLRWGALGKVKQLDERYPGLGEKTPGRSAATLGTPAEQLDLKTVIKASHAVSGEIVLEKLIQKLMTVVVEHAGAERGLLILPHGEEFRIEAEARTGLDKVNVYLEQSRLDPAELPESLLRYVIRTRESVILDDAAAQVQPRRPARIRRGGSVAGGPVRHSFSEGASFDGVGAQPPQTFSEVGNLFSNDEYLRQRRPRSVLCLPLDKQGKLIGILYLENNLAAGVFTPKRLAMVELLASQAAISLDHARLYSELSRANENLEHEINERLRAEAAVRRSEAYLSEAQRLSRTGSFGWEFSTGRQYWSEETFRIFGFEPTTEPTLELVLQRTHPEDRALVRQAMDRVSLEGKTDSSLEHRLLMPDGSVKYLRTWGHLSTNESGSLELVGAVMDITEEKRAEEELRRSQAYLAEAESLSKSGSWAFKPATKEITYWSQERYRLFGFDPEAGIPAFEALLQRIHPEDRTRWLEKTEEAERRDCGLEFRVVLPDGEIKHLYGVGHPVFNESGDLVEVIGAGIDITERKRAERELHQKEVSLREAQSSLAHVSRRTTIGELAVSIAHEVNQPLTAIINNANACLALLPSETTDLDELHAALSDIVCDADRASDIIARIRALVENVPPQKSRLNINETIGEVIALTRSELYRHGVLLQTRLANDLPPIMGDRIQLQQVILNLIINAIEAMSGVTEGPRELLVSSEKVTAVPTPADAGEQARFEPDTSVYPESSAFEGLAKEEGLTPNTSVLVSVADSGPGLDANALDHLFDAFYTTKPQGLGMGLSISRSIVKAHGGRLWAMTNVPKGALFQFTLPIGAE
jgi:PAS domain S-box-containing protein